MPDIANSISSNIHYEKRGSGQALVLIHGFPESGSMWANMADQLSFSFTVITPDLPGSGKSELDHSTSIAEMATCIKDILLHEKIDKVVVAGHSMGGYVACAFACLYPEMTLGLSLIHSTPLADDEEKKTTRRKSIDLVQNGGKRLFMGQLIPNLFSDHFKQAHPEIVERQLAGAMLLEEKSIVNFYEAMMARPDRSAGLSSAAFPIQWILGKEDKLINYKKIIELSHKSYINFVTLMDNCGHMGMFEVPDGLITDLQTFIPYCYAHNINIS